MAISKTTKSMDPKLVAGKQKHEVAYEAKKQGVKPATCGKREPRQGRAGPGLKRKL